MDTNMINESDSALVFCRQNNLELISKEAFAKKRMGEKKLLICDLEHQNAGNTAGRPQFPIRNEEKLFPKDTSKEIL